ncbi:MAG: hypothetical protein LUD50_05115 [Clostridia bacterium]|nr:hypothetical protein [Clostridia bacterium]
MEEKTITETCDISVDVAYPTREQLEKASQELMERNKETYEKLGSEE